MTAAHDHAEMRYLLDHLSPRQVRRLRLLVFDDPELAEVASASGLVRSSAEPTQRRQLRTVGVFDAEPDLSVRVKDILRHEFGSRDDDNQ
ncbi:MAG TPA: hypothetical protein VG317_21515 [Pseudonocardiaceae bacterium]|nr:hypothetical protein [Pseudonocardiaceae bacterium]